MSFSSIASAVGSVASAFSSTVSGSPSSAATGAASSVAAGIKSVANYLNSNGVGSLVSQGINIAKISNARVFLNGGSLVGMAESVTGLGCPKPKFDEFKALGLLSSVNLYSSFEQPEVKIKWTSIYRETAQYLYDPLHAQRFQVRASQEIYKSQGLVQSLPVVVNFTGFVTENSDPSVEQGTAVTSETTIKVISADMTINGTQIYQYDVMANIYNVGGQNVFSQIFSNLGA